MFQINVPLVVISVCLIVSLVAIHDYYKIKKLSNRPVVYSADSYKPTEADLSRYLEDGNYIDVVHFYSSIFGVGKRESINAVDKMVREITLSPKAQMRLDAERHQLLRPRAIFSYKNTAGLIGTGIFLLLAAVMFIAARHHWNKTKTIFAEGVQTTGTVVSILELTDYIGSGKDKRKTRLGYPTVKFTDENEKLVEATSQMAVGHRDYKIDDPVKIIYNRQNHESIAINCFLVLYSSATFLGCLGCALIVAARVFFFEILKTTYVPW